MINDLPGPVSIAEIRAVSLRILRFWKGLARGCQGTPALHQTSRGKVHRPERRTHLVALSLYQTLNKFAFIQGQSS